MRKHDVLAAITEAERFLESARRLLLTREFTDWREVTHLGVCAPKESGDTRRKSMDLTRALADLRRPDSV